jgi:outer membrane protein assembly factor BamB
MKMRRVLVPVAAMVVSLSCMMAAWGEESSHAIEWPQWRGPEGTGVAPGGDPPVTWSEKENVRWKVKLPGSGTATPIIVGNKVFILTAIPADSAAEGSEPARQEEAPPRRGGQIGQPGGGRRPGGGGGGGGFGGGPRPTRPFQFVLLCLDRTNGETLWQKVAREEVPHEGHHRDHGYASASPVTDGEHIYAYFGSRGLYCFDLDGNLKWEKQLGRMQTKNAFGEGSSPALYGDVVVVKWDHEGPNDFIAAFDKRDGSELWRTPRSESTTWTTPLVVSHEGKPQVVAAATSRVRSYDLATGEEVWNAKGLTTNSIPTPVAAGDMVYVMSGFRGAELLAIRLGSKGDLMGTDAIVWSHQKNTPYVPSPLLYGDRLYFSSGNSGVLSCFNAKTGKPHYEGQRIGALSGVYASPVGAADRVYLPGRDGTVVVIKNADTYEELATNTLDERFDASPAIAGKELFLRGIEHLYCLAME